jgi:hypothetical protein
MAERESISYLQTAKAKFRQGNPPDLFGWKAIAAELGVSIDRLFRMRKRGDASDLPAFKTRTGEMAAYSDLLKAWATDI